MKDYLRYQEMIDNSISEYDGPMWNDPAIKYIKRSFTNQETLNAAKAHNLNINISFNQTASSNFLYPLCNSPKRKEYYREMFSEYKNELLRQIANKHKDRQQEKSNSYIKGDTSIPISDTYNEDFMRMQKQFNKYLVKEKSMESSNDPLNFAGDPLKKKDPNYYRVSLWNI